VSMAVVVATGITAEGGREVLGLDVGDSEDEVFWRGFLSALKRRGLSGVRLVISDQHAGLVAALKRAFQGTAHQRCRVHFARNLLAHVPKTHTDMVAAVFRTIFAQPDAATVAATWDEVRDQLTGRFPKIGTLMDAAKAEVTAFTAFPRPHWPKIWSTNPLERVNKEIKRRARVVGIFLNGGHPPAQHAGGVRAPAWPPRAAVSSRTRPPVARTTGNPTALSMGHYALGLVLKKSDPAQALLLLDEAARLAAAVRNFWWEGIALMEAAATRAVHGDPAEAAAALIVVLDQWDRVGDWTQQWLNLRYVVRLLARLGADRDAAVLHHSLVAAGKPSPLTTALPDGVALSAAEAVALARESLSRLR